MALATFTLLGTGSSGGVPRADGDWGLCDPLEPRNRRRRCSALVRKYNAQGTSTNVLIDTSPDLREQLIDAEIKRLDAIVYTHDHADQTHGIDDVRPLVIRARRPIPTFMDAATRGTLTTRFAYCFEGKGGYPPILDLQPDVKAYETLAVDGEGGVVELMPLDMEHGRIRCLGFMIGNLAYCNDVSALPDRTLAALRGVDTLVLDALRRTPHPTHVHLEQALAWIEQISPRQAVLTNMHVDMDYRTLLAELPDNVIPGHDGLCLEFIA